MQRWILLFLFLFASTSSASDWSQTNLQYLNGKGFKDSPQGDAETKTIWTFEHSSGWKYGSNYFFFDVTNGNKTNQTEIYGELSSMLSLPKTLGASTTGWIRDYGPALNLEIPSAPANRANLYGFDLEWNVPFFLSTSLYSRDDLGASGTSTQLTVVWDLPFEFSKTFFIFRGFADITSKEGDLEGSILSQPQLLLDLDKSFGVSGLSAGIEYQYWHNKFGVKDWDENAPLLLIKWNL